MNKILYMLLFLPFMLFAQIPNASFETWANGNPEGWYTTNVAGTVTNVTQVQDAHDGSSALKGEIGQLFTVPYGPSVSPGNTFGPVYIPISVNYERLDGWYKFDRNGGQDELLSVSVTLIDEDGLPTASGVGTYGPASGYTMFSIPIDYSIGSDKDPVELTIQIAIGSEGSFTIGAYFIIDNLSLEGIATALEPISNALPKKFDLKQNYPNPFNPSTTFNFSVPQTSDVSLKVFDITGQEVAHVVNEKLAAGEYSIDWSAENLASGIYIYQLKAGKFVQNKRMTLIK